jgi:hypothetical protein
MERAADYEGFLTVSEVAARLRVRSSWVYEHADDLGVYRLGKYLRFSWSRVLERLEHRDTETSHVGPSTQRPVPLGTKQKTYNARGTDEEQIDNQRF